MAKKIFFLFSFSILALTVILQFHSCEKYVLPELSFTPDTLYFTSTAQTKAVTLTTNVVWETEISVDWIKSEPDFGEGDTLISFTVEENNGDARNTSVNIKTETIQKALIVIQSASDTTSKGSYSF
ncbi:MAG: BACON domain-containing protein [Bacteroidales bacterium]|nr:BACON domain-containing protein [Bacteroidales bacterium]